MASLTTPPSHASFGLVRPALLPTIIIIIAIITFKLLSLESETDIDKIGFSSEEGAGLLHSGGGLAKFVVEQYYAKSNATALTI